MTSGANVAISLIASLRGLFLWSIYSLAQWSFMRAVGIHVPLAYGALVVTTTNLITILPISLGGYGVREGAFTAFLAFPHIATTGQAVGGGSSSPPRSPSWEL